MRRTEPLAPGDIAFYCGESWLSRLVVVRTGPPMCFSHCEIVAEVAADGTATSIGALLRGTVRHELPAPAAVARTGRSLSASGLARALGWLQSRVGARYGWLDILADAAQLILPEWLGSRTPFLVNPAALDCSATATQFLTIAGYPLATALVIDPHRVSPNALWEALARDAVLAEAGVTPKEGATWDGIPHRSTN